MYKCKVAKTSAIWQQPGHTTYQLSSPSCSTRGLHALKPTCKGKILETFMGTCQENGPLAEKTPLSRKSNSTGRKKERGEGKEIEDVPWDCRQGGDNRHLRPAFLLSRLLSGKKGRARMMWGQVPWKGSVRVIINSWHFRLFRLGDPLSQFFDSQSVTYCAGSGNGWLKPSTEDSLAFSNYWSAREWDESMSFSWLDWDFCFVFGFGAFFWFPLALSWPLS